MNEDQLIEAAQREMDLYRAEVARITAQRDEYRDNAILHIRERDEAREQLAKVLGWFGDNTSGRYARVSGTVLARAYRDGGLTVPEELRRFL